MKGRIRKSAPAWLAAVGLALFASLSGAAPLYVDSFEPGDPVDYAPVTGAITFGLPDIVEPPGPLASRAARFSTAGNQETFFYDQAAYAIPAGVTAVSVDLDVMTSYFVGAQNLLFTVFLDAPTINYLQFSSDGVLFASGSGSGSFANDTVLHVSMLFDEGARRWSSRVNGTAFSDSQVYDPAVDLRDVRFAMGFRYGAFSANPLANVYVDNVVISAVPVPGAFFLFVTAMASLAWRRPRKPGHRARARR